MDFDEYSQQISDQLGLEQQVFSDSIGNVTRMRRIFFLIILGLVNLGSLGIIIVNLANGESNSRFILCGAALLGVVLIDAIVFVIYKNNDASKTTTVGIYEKGLLVEAGEDYCPFLFFRTA